MTTENKITKINNLTESINELKHFLFTVDSSKNIRRGIGDDINCVLKIKTDKSFSIFGSRWYGCGTAKQEIPVPNELVGELEYLAEKRLNTLIKERNELLGINEGK